MNQELEKEFDQRFPDGMLSMDDVRPRSEQIKSFIDTHYISRKEVEQIIGEIRCLSIAFESFNDARFSKKDLTETFYKTLSSLKKRI